MNTLRLVLVIAGVVLGGLGLFRADERLPSAGVVCIGLAFLLPSLAT